jgi:phenylalanyl-tRNA synthetase beta chain
MQAPKIWLEKYVDLSGISDKQFAEKMTFAGNKVEVIHKIDGQTVYQFEITSNRPDTLSIIGLAREAAAVFNKKFSPPKIPQLTNPKAKPISLKVANKNLCPTYSLVEINHVEVKPSSQSIQKLLTLAGMRPVNNIVDIANFMLWEHTQLMHTFDADKIKGNLNLRLAKPKEKIITLDHKTRQLLGGEIIIEDEEKIIDVPGLMGGLNTEISHHTTRVLLLVAIDNPVLVRRASKNLKLRSPSSTRSEKKLDLTQTAAVAKRVIKLIEKESDGQQSTQLITSPSNWRPPTIKLNIKKLNSLIGIDFTQSQVDKYLKSIGLTKTSSGYQPPPWRRDLEAEVDLIEEVTRLHGFNRLPRTLPTGTIPIHQTTLRKNWPRLIKNQLASLGYTETYSSTLINQTAITTLDLNPKTHLKVLHPMSQDYEYMRTTILQSLIPLIKPNLKSTTSINLFELGTVFYPSRSKAKLPDQPLELGLISTSTTYRQLKGHLENLARHLNLQLEIKPSKHPCPMLHPSNQAEIYLKNKLLGILGQTLDKKAWAASLNISELIKSASTTRQYPTISGYPPIIEDMTFTLPSKTYLGPVIAAIKATHKLIRSVKLTKVYKHNHTFNLTYQSQTKPLTDKTIAPIRKKITAGLSRKFKAKLVGKL